SATLAAVGIVVVYAGGVRLAPIGPVATPVDIEQHRSIEELAASMSNQEIVEQFCVRCHSDRRLQGNLSLEGYDADVPESNPALSEQVIVKLRAGMMPPPGSRRPEGDTVE